MEISTAYFSFMLSHLPFLEIYYGDILRRYITSSISSILLVYCIYFDVVLEISRALVKQKHCIFLRLKFLWQQCNVKICPSG